mmetsp:Transcript_4707/g.15636  ORF Transcript_4707/g.15636 Transcript_4707/m.15636 type:complete len:291 (+) Transcript_4707:992-1864(+)
MHPRVALAQRARAGAEHLAQLRGALREALVADHLERGHGHAAGERVTPVGGAVRARGNDSHDGVVAEHSGHGHRAARERLAQHEHVGPHALVVAGEELARAREARLDLVGDEEYIVRLAEPLALGEVALRGHHHAGLALDGLDVEGHHGLGALQLLLERRGGAVLHQVEARREGPIVCVAVRVARGAAGCEGAAPKVVLGHDHLGRVVRDALDPVPPLAGDLDRGLPRLHSAVHREHLVVVEVGGDEPRVGAQLVVVEGPGGEGQRLGLVYERPHDVRVRVALVDRRVGR